MIKKPWSLLKSVFPDSADHNEPSKVIAAKLKVDDLIWVAETEKGEIIGCCMGGYDGVRRMALRGHNPF